MPQPKTLALLLFGSLGLNLFLGGALGSHLISSRKGPEFSDVQHMPTSEFRETRDKMMARPSRHNGRDGGHPSPRVRGAEEMSISADLALFRHMVRIMGGPADPRLKQLREKRKSDMIEMRREVHAAHERVRAALSTEDANEKELAEALKHLRKTTFEAQARAQEGILLLASLMTPEERKRLSHFEPPTRRDKGKREVPSPQKSSE